METIPTNDRLNGMTRPISPMHPARVPQRNARIAPFSRSGALCRGFVASAGLRSSGYGARAPSCPTLPAMTIRNFALLLGLVSALTVSAPAEATIILPLSVEQLTTRADIVVRGRVLAEESDWGTKRRRIYTKVRVAVLAQLRGAKVPSEIEVRTLGGVVGDVGMNVSGVAKFAPEEEVFLFLRTHPGQKDGITFQVVGMAQGKYRIERSADSVLAVPSWEGLAFARGRGQVGHAAPPEPLKLDALVAQVRAASATVPTPDLPTPAVNPPAIQLPPEVDVSKGAQ